MSLLKEVKEMFRELTDISSKDLHIPKIIGYPIWFVVFILIVIFTFTKYLFTGVFSIVRNAISWTIQKI